MKEVWIPIKGYEGLYEISNYGNVKALNYRNRGITKNITPKKHNRGYLHVILYKQNTSKSFLVHRLVAEHFIKKDANQNEINHKDGDKTNNHIDNLEWCTHKENIHHFLDCLIDKKYGGVRKRRAFKRLNKVLQLDMNNNLLKTWDNLSSIKHALNFNESHIQEVCEQKRKTAYGYKWKYAD